MTELTLGKALGAGLRQAMRDDDKVVLLGEDIGKLGGVFRITDGLLDEFGAARVIDTPLAESGIVGTAVGLAFRGYRPVVEIQFDGFVYPAFDQIVAQVAKLHYRTQGRVKMPITIRIPWAGGIGAAEHHSESPEAYFVHTAGIRVIAVSNPEDAYRACVRRSRRMILWSSSSRSGSTTTRGTSTSKLPSRTRRRWDWRASCGQGRMRR